MRKYQMHSKSYRPDRDYEPDGGGLISVLGGAVYLLGIVCFVLGLGLYLYKKGYLISLIADWFG